MGDFKICNLNFFSLSFLGANPTPSIIKFATKSHFDGHPKASTSL